MELRLRRIRADLRQYRVAQELGIPRSVLCDYENGRRPVPAQHRERILAAIERLSLARGLERGVDGLL
jgi:predicted transcriptional regulator